MTNETSLIRVHKGLRDRLKAMGKKQGRTLEWMANEAIEQYMGMGAEFIEPTPPAPGKTPESQTVIVPVTVKKNETTATPKVFKSASPSANLCKVHGMPLTMFGKCLVKGCKYA